ncbi:MAG TPA: hypothetical protein VGL02_15685, partial [Streptomyces sp.]
MGVLGGGPYRGRTARSVLRRLGWLIVLASLAYMLGWTVAAGVGVHDAGLVASLMSLAVSVIAL